MNALGIETATETVGVAVRAAAGVEAELALTGRRRHVETLTPAVDHLLGLVGLVPGDLEVVAVDVGPGLFTGLRVGVAAAKGLAQALGIGVVGVTSLDILSAAAAAGGRSGLVLAAVDARRGELFAVLREMGPDGAACDVVGPCLVSPASLADELTHLGGEAVHVVGDGALRYRDVLGAVPGVVVAAAPAFPPPAILLHLALCRLDAGEEPTEPGSVVPLYMREADARANFERAGRAVSVQLRIEKLKRRDLRKLLPIENTVFPEPWSPQVFNSELSLRRGRLYRAAWDGDQLAGYIGFLMVDEEAHMTTIATAPAYRARRRGHRAHRRRHGHAAHHGHPERLARGGGEQRRGAVAVPSLRLRSGRRAQELLPGHRSGCAGDVGLRRRQRRVRRSAP